GLRGQGTAATRPQSEIHPYEMFLLPKSGKGRTIKQCMNTDKRMEGCGTVLDYLIASLHKPYIFQKGVKDDQ
ncbi:MAG: hypothetical protein NUW24_14905, partial [Anaerolineae bacterium]|nr:hypothetical protein [Anaerolineae bacterium]